MLHGSLFSGIEGFGLGFERAGFRTVWQVECDPFCNAVLATYWPHVERFSDIRLVGRHCLTPVDVITAGVPCQDWSVAGKRAGIAGERSGLFFEFARILRELRPPWFVFENVPGLLSAGGGRDFAVILSTLAEIGYGLAWRVLDSRFFGVAQRRRRVFIVGSLGTMRAAEVLFERQGGAWNTAPGGEAGKDVAYALAASVRGTGDGHGNAWNSNYVSSLDGTHYADREAEHTRLVVSLRHLGRGGPDDNEAQAGHIVAQPIRTNPYNNSDPGMEARALVIEQNTQCSMPELPSERSHGTPNYAVYCAPLDADRMRDFAGLPEGLDSPRYRGLGNAVTVQVAEWIARRISGVHRHSDV